MGATQLLLFDRIAHEEAMNRLPSKLAMLLALSLTACTAAGVTIGTSDVSHGYRPNELGFVGSGNRALRVNVVNNPFPAAPNEVVSEAVVASMQGRVPLYPVNFATEPGEREYRPERRYRVLMIFDPPRGLRSVGLCRRDDLETAAVRAPDDASDPSKVRVLGAYCQGERTLTRATGTAPRGAGPTDPTFDALIAQMTRTMFPSRNRSLENDDCERLVLRCS